nr:ribosomal protein S18-alanine N-acetyltransferase [Methanocella sp. CWC-04]
MIDIRPFEPEDTRAVIELEEEIFHEPSPILYSMIERYPIDGFYVAECDGVVCGYLIGVVLMDEARILLLGVKQEYRRKTIGSMLANYFIESVRRITNMVRLEVRSSNLAAQTFYFKMGFRFVGIINGYYKNGESAYVMIKPLDQLTLFL